MADYQYPSALPVTTTGGWARPGWWDVVADGEKAGRFGPADRQELLDDYCRLAIYDQESAGPNLPSFCAPSRMSNQPGRAQPPVVVTGSADGYW